MGSQSNFHGLKSRFNGPADSSVPPLLNKPGFGALSSLQVKPRPPDAPTPPNSGLTPKPKPPPNKPSINAASMDTRFKPPVPPGKFSGSTPSPNKPANSISALKESLEKGGQDSGSRPLPTTTPKPAKFTGTRNLTSEGEKTPKFPGARIPPADGDKTPKFPGARITSADGGNTPKFPGARITPADGEKPQKFPGARIPPTDGDKTPKFPGARITPADGGNTPKFPGARIPPTDGEKTPKFPGARITPVDGENTPKFPGARVTPTDSEKFPGAPKFPGARTTLADGQSTPKFPGARITPSDGEKTTKFPAARTPSAAEEKQPKFPAASGPKPPAPWMKLSQVKQSEPEPQNEPSSQSPAHNDTGSTPNAAGLVHMQKKLFMGRQNDSESPKEVSTPNVLGAPRSSVSSIHDVEVSTQPKKKPLPGKVSLGMCPAKPRRPPLVDLQLFKNHGSVSSSADDFPPPPPPDPPAVPPLPLRVVEEESYDDVGMMNTSQSKPGQISEEVEDEFDEDSETYEDIEDRWPDAENEKPSETKDSDKSKKDKELKKQQKKMKKEEKEKAERERKEKKEMEKREQEARKKFKLKGPVEVQLRGTAKADCKGSKTDLELDKGEPLEIIRMIGNPEGHWLARDSQGYYGYVKADLVAVEGSDQQPVTQDVYDDVAGPDQPNSPTQEPEGDGDIYDCVDDGGSDSGFPPPPPPPPADGDTYDDVISTSSLPSPPQVKTDEMDAKKKKKFEKELKEFRKKFKYEKEIHVLYEVTVLPVLACKKFGGKDLVIKPGDVISVITEPKDGKVIGRNSEGKFGFVSVSNFQQDSDIYDDVGEDCVYDND
ncbi:FYN-binding protein 1 isoform X2 [Colossoma macropomum]|uniref:FYN-binding protein 1 isoform X2 n=1 Tax=Colossoma macropomum TaxID=42526 RepID=UPI001863CF46|nr:FYN-binding protein 1 isoform X2 [Colossoma macropomum]